MDRRAIFLAQLLGLLIMWGCSGDLVSTSRTDARISGDGASSFVPGSGTDSSSSSTTKNDGSSVSTKKDGSATSAKTDAGGSKSDAIGTSNFSFFVMSLEQIKKWGGAEGLGGNLGGLAGADAKCQEAAEAVGSKKTWRAFLSVTNDGTGKAINAIDRIGTGPWYNVKGLLVASNITGLLNTRPAGSTDIVYNNGYQNWPFNQCLTTELGNCNLSYGDTHDTLTGSNRQGKLYSSDKKYTCNDWTSTNVAVQLPIGHSWPRKLNGTDDGEAHWIYAHSNCTGGSSCNGCGANINIANTMEAGVGGDGGYGAWYCFAIN